MGPSGATPATKQQLSSKAAGKLPAHQLVRRPSLLPAPKASASGGTGHDVRDSMAEAEVEFREITQEFDHGTKEHPGREIRRGSLKRLNEAARAALAAGVLSTRRGSASAKAAGTSSDATPTGQLEA